MFRNWFDDFSGSTVALAACVLLMASVAFGQNCSTPNAYGQPSCSAPGPVGPQISYGTPVYSAPVVSSAVELPSVTYSAPTVTYSAPIVMQAPPMIVQAAPVVQPQAFYVPATGTWASTVFADPWSPSGYSAPVGPVGPRPMPAAGYRHYHYRATPAGAVRINAWN